MLDFVDVKEKLTKQGIIEIEPLFKVRKTTDLMTKGKSFYAIWDEKAGLWSTDEYDVQRLVDEMLYDYKNQKDELGTYRVQSLLDFSTGKWNEYQQYVKLRPDSLVQLDTKVTFANSEVRKEDYVSKRLPYAIGPGDISAYEELISTLYLPEERRKIEWAIGSIISGDSKNIQKFLVLYGKSGAGKSTVLNIIEKMFDGYCATFDAKALGGSNNIFSAEALRDNPLVAIQHDGDLSRIEDNTRINSIVSHEKILMNEKRKSQYPIRLNGFLFMGTNKPVKITDAKSGIIRRLIDVTPSGDKVSPKRYKTLVREINFELGAIAQHCLDVYSEMGPNYYENYTPIQMMYKTDVFFNFVESYSEAFEKQNWIQLNDAYGLYKIFCDEALIDHKLPKYKFREELKEYFDEFHDMTRIDGLQMRSVYVGFKKNKLIQPTDIFEEEHKEENKTPGLILDSTNSLLDIYCKDCPAQYASRSETPLQKWSEVTSVLDDINTKRVHYVKVPENMIVIDFDLKDENGNKSMEKNLEAASKWKPTYAEFSKSGAGVHLHYIYTGDVSKLNCLYSEGIEVKVFKGNSSLRRKLTKCNELPIAEISSGLPLKGAKKMIDFEVMNNEKTLRKLIANNLMKKYHPATKPSVDFIYKLLDDAYNSGMSYDVSNMYADVLTFAMDSTNNAEYCVKLVGKMHFMSADIPVEEKSIDIPVDERPIAFYDVEVYPNLFLVVYKEAGKSCKILYNPTPVEVSNIVNSYRLIGFNNRRYDNHIMYGRMIGYTNEQLFELSQKIVSGKKNNPAYFREAYGLSYTDVYDYANADNKMSLKKWEIALDIHHQEMAIPWDQPVDESLWPKVAEYCSNDVIATEVVHNHLEADWTAREILADISGLTVNDTTNMHTTRIIFGTDSYEEVQSELQYTDLSEMFHGYSFDNGVSTYMGEETGEGGYVYAEPGMYSNVALLDIASMHPTSIENLNLFGKYTKRFSDLKRTRILIKHKDYSEAKQMFDGKLKKYLTDDKAAKKLSNALKTAINSVYGLTSAKFENKFRDPRNKDNIVAKRGALFMINLKHEVQKRGYTVAHIKTDSIKIPNATKDIIDFVMSYGEQYGYTFEHEATYSKLCLVNNAVYIAKDASDGHWTATGAQFQHPFVFKALFSKEPITFKDVCETKSVKDSLYLDMNEDLEPDEHNYVFVGKVGSFCPVAQGQGGGELVVLRNDKYVSATGAKGYRWLEAETLKPLISDPSNFGPEMNKLIDISYFDELVNDAWAQLDKYGDPTWFMSDDDGYSEEEPLPWEPPCKDAKIANCGDCHNYVDGKCLHGYDLSGYLINKGV